MSSPGGPLQLSHDLLAPCRDPMRVRDHEPPHTQHVNAKVEIPIDAPPGEGGVGADEMPPSAYSIPAPPRPLTRAQCRCLIDPDDCLADAHPGVVRHAHHLHDGPKECDVVCSRGSSERKRTQNERDPTPHGATMSNFATLGQLATTLRHVRSSVALVGTEVSTPDRCGAACAGRARVRRPSSSGGSRFGDTTARRVPAHQTGPG